MYDQERRKLKRWRLWLIITGIPIAFAQLALASVTTGLMSTASLIAGVYISIRVVDLFFERD